MKELYSAGLVPPSRLETWRLNFCAMFRIVSFILAFFLLFFAWDFVAGKEIRNGRLLLSTATLALLLRAAEFVFLVWSEYDPRRTTVRVSSGFFNLAYRFALTPSSGYVAIAFLFALALQARSGLYPPLLGASLGTLIFIVMDFIAVCLLSAKGGGQGLSESEME